MTLASFTIASWLFGFLGVFWTHNVYMAPALFCTLQYGVAWMTMRNRQAPAGDQMHLHVTHIIAVYLGVIVGSVAMLTQETPVRIDVNLVRRGHLRPLVFLWFFSIVTLVAAYFFSVHAYDPFVSERTHYIAAAVFGVLGLLLLLSTSSVQWWQSHDDRDDLLALLLLCVLALSTQLYDELEPRISPYHVPLMLVAWLCAYYIPLVLHYPKQCHFWQTTAVVHLVGYAVAGTVDQYTECRRPVLVFFSLLTVSLLLILYFYVRRRDRKPLSINSRQ